MSIYAIEVMDSNNSKVKLENYKGKVMLIVNTATKCGYTNQYKALQELYDKYKKNGLVILDFPSNQFLGQAPGKIDEIKEFCELNFGTTFPIFSKVKVNGPFAHPVYKYLKKVSPRELNPGELDLNKPRKLNSRIKWNFTKFLVDREGNVVRRFEPTEDLGDVKEAIEALL